MNRITLFAILLFCYVGHCAAQSVVKIPFNQPALFTVSPLRVEVSLDDENEAKEIGTEIEINGGSGNYAFEWLAGDGDSAHNEVLGTDPTLAVHEAGVYRMVISDQAGCRSVVTFEVTGTVGIAPATTQTLALYPNPTRGPVHIQTDRLAEVSSISILSIGGKVIRTIPCPAPADESFILVDLTDLPNGYYLIVVGFETEKITKIVIKQ